MVLYWRAGYCLFAQEEVVDQDSPVFGEEGDIDDESDIEFAQGGEEEEEESGGNIDLNLDLASESDPNPNDPNNPFPWSTTLHDVEVELFTRRTGPNLDLFDLDYSANPIDFFNLYISDSFMTLAAEQTTGAQTSFKPVTVDETSKYFYINMVFGIHKLPTYIFAMKCVLPNFMRMCLTV
ncbi:hypothetical protein RRG08_064704 [Elysia crispata]|uniref:PiggyBac transposable element-derived protein domain-containing protein n=1 Tax=Elysia crispata TaxID=231223 RepID=A0AAE0Z0V3_9GAST|nr:hypothetical protein RRG08_064704 [Elysia crispata]